MVTVTIPHCRFCGGALPKGRIDRAFCKDAHRQAYYRWRKKLNKLEDKAKVAVEAMAEYLKYPTTSVEAMASLQSIREEIMGQIRKSGVRVQKHD